ncbi:MULTISPECIES: nickel-responsive transcriptional regulator NikR [Burkholderia cepacia complex]|uniref:nickel-responsive transcriptional regulator NikR n=1 Tax=Burkholderia cepacia complex TaxID=87882 RepID=UPI000CFEE196|nr:MULTISPECIES: nickel-responsive transcriptional regulator NikR [Burkholderia cepacia complex]MBR8304735.1 nickel-responsive transcriptional regulator NikR [Burkholderia dolosa]MDN8051293.1 nickel-responsive transcriptional regulator NikR [Burkholderia multivorans]PRH27391.1 nickel-responsive transcriptional regulator NikR [Burkholderia multivorans]
MQRITITIDDDLLETVDAMVAQRGYTSRSEAFRDLVRESRAREPAGATDDQCIATLTYVYDHATRDLARRITQAHHDRHDLAVASMRVHLDHDSLLESSVLRGRVQDVQVFADSVGSQRGVRFARLHTIPVSIERTRHHHGNASDQHDHLHV